MKKFWVSLFFGMFLVAVGQGAYADRRSYVWTYEYMTMPKGMFEIEYYLTHSQAEMDKTNPSTQKHYFELEYGVTEHLDIALYQRFKQSNEANSSGLEYDGFKVRARYRFLEKDDLPIDTLLYLEYIRDDDFSNPHVFEGKLILAKDIGRFNVAYNPIIKQELESGGKTEHEYSAGLSYRLKPNFKVGVESKGNYTDEKYYLGPTVSWSKGKFWSAFGVGVGLNNKSDDIQTRLIVGMLF